MKPDSEVGRQAIRFSLGLGTTDEEVRQTCAAVERAAQTLRVMNE
jgi:cysteine sulfinate desulfinase/cysteine desulfurase-like protein